MKWFKDCWAAVLSVTDLFTLSPFQKPLTAAPHVIPHEQLSDIHHAPVDVPIPGSDNLKPVDNYIIFPPPHITDPESDDFVCEYPHLSRDEWEDCSTPNDRGCWLKHKNGTRYDVCTNYEKIKPPGRLRVYNFTINRAELNLDGVTMKHGVVFDDGKNNPKYPGPWVRACWGDTVRVHIHNNITKFNGTSVHWHGIRQLHTMEMDGVNAITQCPVAPNDSYTYEFETWQYGTSWYHSHYSLQYADGLVGPMTIYGPSSANWDESKKPTLMTDWNHRSAFEDFARLQWGGGKPYMDSILLNGMGNFAGMHGSRRYNLTFEPGKRYLLRLINTAVDTSFVFAIDNHTMEVMSADFVPIKPYKTDHIVVGIGQRYHVVVQAHTKEEIKATGKSLKDQNFWIRTIPADGCSLFERGNLPDQRQGIIRYDNTSEVIPRTARSDFSTACRDEDPAKLTPILSWQVGEAINDWRKEDQFGVGLVPPSRDDPFMYGNFQRWAIGDRPMWLNFSEPSILQLDVPPEDWDSKAIIIPEGAKDTDWVWLLITGTSPDAYKPGDLKRVFVSAAHPMHLHGHDFAILQQSSETLNSSNFKDLIKPNLDNPPRRDVVLLPADGFVLIAFRADNPGVWIMHCHIAYHASSGLALQVLERQGDIAKTHGKHFLDQVKKGCKNWKHFFNNTDNLWDKHDPTKKYFQDDSGI